MNLGVIATRYARALYAYAFEQGQEDRVYTEVKCMLQQFITIPELKQSLTSPIMKRARKLELLKLAAGGDAISPVMERFIDFVVGRDKQEILQFMCAAYETVYREKKNILFAKFISATQVEPLFLDKIKTLIETTYKANIEIEAKVDENLIGGFILDVDNNRLDASVAGELNKIKAAFFDRDSTI